MRGHAKILLVALSLGFTVSTVAVTAAEAQQHRGERYRVTVCKRTKGGKGTVIGGLTGGTLGAAVSNNRTQGALIGGVVGAVAGNQIAKKKVCHYEYRYR
jgi:outer membrane lipoprotein SlyB